MAALSFVLSLYLRLGDEQMHMVSGYLFEGTILFTVVCGLVFWRMRFYRALWRYASLPDLIALTKGVTLAILVFVPLLFLATRLMDYPRSAVVINWFVLLALLGGPRFLYRMIKDRGVGWVLARASGNTSDNRVPVLLVGAGDAAEMFIREMARGVVRAPYRVIGALDDDRSIIGGQIHGVRIFASISEVAAVVDKLTRRGVREPAARGRACHGQLLAPGQGERRTGTGDGRPDPHGPAGVEPHEHVQHLAAARGRDGRLCGRGVGGFAHGPGDR